MEIRLAATKENVAFSATVGEARRQFGHYEC
jgi:hypothetical protein